MRALIQSLLGAFGVGRIYTANDGEHGFEMVLAKDPDLIITDWMMDPVNGIEFTKMIRTRDGVPNPFVPVIMMTGFSSKMRVEEARDMGITEFLAKPFTAYELYRRVAQVIEKPRKFVKANTFFGPDRRRIVNSQYNGPMRRGADDAIEEMTDEQRRASQVIRDIRKRASGSESESET